ncbi:MAG: peptidoglycan DD-metalloendopeptidase family protein [Lachnospiraceae bacterium]|nr:peptidoglycan DD-metalloendopeptidase family protein [Lachnospiraceae bacterium]
MKRPFSKRLNKWIAFTMALCLAASFPMGVAADEETTEVNINDPGEVDESKSSSSSEEKSESKSNSSQSSVRQPSAAVAAANKAVQEGNAAVSSAKNEKGKMESGLEKAQSIKNELVKDRNEINEAVMALDGQIQDVSTNLDEVSQLLDQKERELEETSAKLIQARADAQDQYESMKIRIKFMYEKGTMDFIQILLGAGTFSEMLNKAEYIEQLSAYDRNMLVRYEDTKEKMQTLEEELSLQQQVLAEAKQDVENKKKEMEGLMDEKTRQLQEYNSEIKDKEEAIAEYEAMIKEQDATIRDLEALAAAARARQQAAIAAEAGVSGNSAVQYTGGKFAWPAPSYTRISDDYGNRIHPVLGVEKFHNGIDMAAPSGSPILAAADGEVVAAAYSATMGNYIMIDHGSNIYTIYMHASSLSVSAGNKVKKGATIGAVGSTGRSTGAHLHFSVRVNGSYVNPWSYLK